jgi:predicted ATPase with chaperone activity
VTSVFGEGIWIPRAIHAANEIIRLFDPTKHEELPWGEELSINDARIDRRWVYVKRPTIVVGGELRLENLEVTTNEVTGISEAPIQMKANCGTLVIDDFGRQKFNIDALLNRLIIPLERRNDILNLRSGRSFDVPFDLLMVFSTNLSPENLVDEAFLRRVPFTIHAADPSEAQYREVFANVAEKFGLTYEPSVLDHLIQTHYVGSQRPFRFCQPRDILQQVANSCDFARSEKVITNERIDAAIDNCLAIRVDQ